MKKPIQSHGALFQAVQLSRLFKDSKSFPDATALKPPEEIEAAFRNLLADFIDEYFQVPGEVTPTGFHASLPMEEHIAKLWPQLFRQPKTHPEGLSTLIPLPHPYVVPGGRFREIYYWDSYFTCEGLAAAGHIDMVESMVRNFAYLIDQFGHIPNGNRTYYQSRSQPPFFYKMLQLLEREQGFDAIREFLPRLQAEYGFWMKTNHAVRLPDGSVLNRYWDDQNTPREESFAEDTALFFGVEPEHQAELYRHIRAAAESGWDFSSRWFRDGRNLATIHTTDVLPIDLNCLIFGLEQQMGAWLETLGNPTAEAFRLAAQTRRANIDKYFWNETLGWFFDYSLTRKCHTDVWSLAGVFPLYCGVAREDQASRIADHLIDKFLKPGGLVTTLAETGQQWDSPNGWAPLQWVAVCGLLDAHQTELAIEIAQRFVHLAEKVYRATGKMMEKYNVCDIDLEAGGGEYPLQDGFGWTNGVILKLLELIH